MATYTVQAPDGKTITLQGPDGASQSDVIAQAQKLYQPQAVDRTQVHSSFGTVGDALAGVGGNFAQHAVNVYDLIRKIPGADKVLPDSAKLHEAIADATPDNTPSHIGQFIESTGEYAMAASKASKLAEGAKLLGRMGAQGVAVGTVRAAQGGDLGQVTDAAALGAAVPAVGAAVGAVAPKIAAAVPAAVKQLALSAAGKATGLPIRSIVNGIEKALSDAPAAATAAAERVPVMAADIGGVPVATLDAAAQKMGLKSFADIPKEQQPLVVNLTRVEMQRLAQQASATALRPAAVPEPQTTAPQPIAKPAEAAPPVSARPDPKAIITKSDIAKRALADEMLKSGSATPEMMTDPTVPDAKALKTLMRDLPPGGPKAIANANYAGNQEPAQAAAVYEAAGRAAKSQALSQMLYDEGLSSRQVARWSPKAWDAAANDRGMPTAFSKESQGEVIQMLRKLEKTVPK